MRPPVNGEVTGSSDGLYTLHDVWERPPANNLPQTPHSAGAYDTGYILLTRPPGLELETFGLDTILSYMHQLV
jgi:hypothetical protein